MWYAFAQTYFSDAGGWLVALGGSAAGSIAAPAMKTSTVFI